MTKSCGDHYMETIQSMYSNSIRTSSFGVIYLIQSTITVIVVTVNIWCVFVIVCYSFTY